VTIEDLQAEYDKVLVEYNYWSEVLRRGGCYKFGVQSTCMGLYNQAASLECLFRRLSTPERWAVGEPLGLSYTSAAADLLGKTVEKLTP